MPWNKPRLGRSSFPLLAATKAMRQHMSEKQTQKEARLVSNHLLRFFGTLSMRLIIGGGATWCAGPLQW